MSAFQTNTLVEGVWTGQTVDLQAVLEHHRNKDAKAAESKAIDTVTLPELGIYSQTVIESPVIHWILPCRLRSQRHNDVAFIGHHGIQIREFWQDGHLRDVARMSNFGSRIVNACVLTITNLPSRGSSRAKESEGESAASESTSESDDTVAPQCLVLALQDGHLAFLHAATTDHGVEFLISRHTLSKPMMGRLPGIQLAIDPSSRYLAVSSFQGLFTICTLRSKDEIHDMHLRRQSFHPIIEERYIRIDGIIHKMEFLYPAPDDPDHVILILLVVSENRSRLLVYEWEAGQELPTIQAHSRKGHVLPEQFKMPLLMIPLRLKSAFLLICESIIVVYRDILVGSPSCEVVEIESDAPTTLHTGIRPPLWSAWARPSRMDHYASKHDDLYIAREDGVVKFLETINSEIGPYMSIGNLQCSVGTAFTTLDPERRTPKLNGDLLIAGGETCNGGMYEVKARKVASFIEPISNWSPTVDFITTSKLSSECIPPDYNLSRNEYLPETAPTSTDKVYVCAGKGTKGSVAELRYGLEARIGFDINCGSPSLSCWALPATFCFCPSPSVSTATGENSVLFLLNMGSHSLLLFLAQDGESITELEQDLTSLDLSAPTLLLKTFPDFAVQISNANLIITTGPLATGDVGTLEFVSQKFPLGRTVSYADMTDSRLAMLASESELTFLCILDGGPQVIGERIDLDGEATCVKFVDFGDEIYGVCGISGCPQGAALSFYHIQPETGRVTMTCQYDMSGLDTIPDASLQAFGSLTVIEEHDGSDKLLVAGLRNGTVIVLRVGKSEEGLSLTKLCEYKFGETTVNLVADGQWAAFVCCESRVYRISTKPRGDRSEAALSIHRIWFTDGANPSMPQPRESIFSICRTHTNHVLFSVGTQLYLVDVESQPKGIPRHLHVNGTPMRVIYSHILEALVVAVQQENRTTLRFLDEQSGEDISMPLERSGQPVPHISGMGKENERVLGLVEWLFEDAGLLYHYLILCTSGGRLVLISAQRSRGSPPKIEFFTRNKYKGSGPILALSSSDRGIFFCVGNALRWETLDVKERRFKRLFEMDLPSPAVSIKVHQRTMTVVTRGHSVLAFRLSRADQIPTLTPIFTDEVYRSGLHQALIQQDLMLISDLDSTVAGLWSPLLKDQNLTLSTTGVARPLFEAELDCSIIRLRQLHGRPIWDDEWKSTKPWYADTLGLSIHGSLHYFKILSPPVWRLMRLIQDLAERSSIYSPVIYDRVEVFDDEQLRSLRRMHINGDFLIRIASNGGLGALLLANLWRKIPLSMQGHTSETDEDEDTVKMARAIEARLEEILAEIRLPPRYIEVTDPLEKAYILLDHLVRPVI